MFIDSMPWLRSFVLLCLAPPLCAVASSRGAIGRQRPLAAACRQLASQLQLHDQRQHVVHAGSLGHGAICDSNSFSVDPQPPTVHTLQAGAPAAPTPKLYDYVALFNQNFPVPPPNGKCQPAP